MDKKKRKETEGRRRKVVTGSKCNIPDEMRGKALESLMADMTGELPEVGMTMKGMAISLEVLAEQLFKYEEYAGNNVYEMQLRFEREFGWL